MAFGPLVSDHYVHCVWRPAGVCLRIRGQRVITHHIGNTGKRLHNLIVRGFAASGINPNVLTFIGFSINLLAAYLFAYGYFRWAALTVVFAAIFDLTDGPVARLTGRVTPFGGFFDSVLDRYSDLCLSIGLLVYYGRIGRFWYVTLVAGVMIGAVMTSYTRARAESLISTCKVGFLERPERIVLILIGAIFDRMAPALWVTFVLSNVTVIHRMIYTYHESQRLAGHPTRLGWLLNAKF